MAKNKIGILTLPLHQNYGGILQAFALVNYLEKQGQKVELIRLSINNKNAIIKLLKLFKQIVFVKILKRAGNIKPDARTYHIQRFIDEKLKPKTFEFESEHILSLYSRLFYKTVVVGSDQVWRDKYTLKNSKYYFLNFLDVRRSKKVSYAASFGTDQWESSSYSTQEVEAWLRDFHCISVRENSGVDICKEVFHVEAEYHLDPTLLLSAQDYVHHFKLRDKPKDYIFAYILDKDPAIDKSIAQLSKHSGLKVKMIDSVDKDTQQLPSIAVWLESIMNARYIITDSFHGTAFSIIFKKDFWVLGNKERGLSRFNSLLEKLELKHRLLENLSLVSISNEEHVDYGRVEKIIDLEQDRSADYFKNFL